MTPAAGLDGRVAVVTGAGRGIGRGCALGLAEAGADVIAIARTRQDVEDVAEEVERAGRTARAVVCDVTNARRLGQVMRSLERVDILVNAAGTNVPEPFLEVDELTLDALIEVNVKGTFLAAQAVARRMLEIGEGGAIVNVSSQMGHVGAAGRSVYCTTKHAVEGMTKALALELAQHGIRVNSVAPTFVETPMTAPFLADERFRAHVLERIPLGRIGRVTDVVGAVLFLASPAAGLITGASLRVDGGWTAQ
jgi:NAD(P)-dependent dehydrogenase (short-subunit alcohol dehydrogenase family)